MKIKKFCLRERNRFLKNSVFHQEATTGSTVHDFPFSLLYSIVFRFEKKGKKNFLDLRVYINLTLILKVATRNQNY